MVGVALKLGFPHLDFEMRRALRYAFQNGKRVVLESDGRVLMDEQEVPELRSLYTSRADQVPVVYAILAGEFIKIGRTSNLPKRLSQIQNGNPHFLEVIAAWRGDAKEERRLHQKLSAHRASGEWFADSSEVRKAIKRASRGAME
jgi:hypothetical protein